MSARPRYCAARGKLAGASPGICCRRTKTWTMAKPKPISETAVRIHDIIVRSTLARVRSQAKGSDAVALTSNLSAIGPASGDPLPDGLTSVRAGSLTPNPAAVPRYCDRPIAAWTRCWRAPSPDFARGRASAPPARDTRDRAADQQVRNEGKQHGDKQRLHRIECIELQE